MQGGSTPLHALVETLIQQRFSPRGQLNIKTAVALMTILLEGGAKANTKNKVRRAMDKVRVTDTVRLRMILVTIFKIMHTRDLP